jgi:hypothetical protein
VITFQIGKATNSTLENVASAAKNGNNAGVLFWIEALVAGCRKFLAIAQSTFLRLWTSKSLRSRKIRLPANQSISSMRCLAFADETIDWSRFDP